MVGWRGRGEDDIPVTWVQVSEGLTDEGENEPDPPDGGPRQRPHRRWWIWIAGALIVLGGVRGLAAMEHAPGSILSTGSAPAVNGSSSAAPDSSPCPIGASCAKDPFPDPGYAAAFHAAFPQAPDPAVSLVVDADTKQRYQVLIQGATGGGATITLVAQYSPHGGIHAATGWSFSYRPTATTTGHQAAGASIQATPGSRVEVILLARTGTALPMAAASRLAHAPILQLGNRPTRRPCNSRVTQPEQ